MNEEYLVEFKKSELLHRGIIFIKELEEEGLSDHEIIYTILSLLSGCVNVYSICTEDLERIFNQIRSDTHTYRNYWEQCG